MSLSGALLFEHDLCNMSQFSCTQSDKRLFAYLTCEGPEATMRCHMYKAYEEMQVYFMLTGNISLLMSLIIVWKLYIYLMVNSVMMSVYIQLFWIKEVIKNKC